MQTRIRKNLLGEDVWQRIEKKRAAKMDQAFQPLNYAELFAKAVVLDVQAGGKTGQRTTGYEDEEEKAPEDEAERPATPEDDGPGDIVIERAANSPAAALALSGSGAKDHTASAGGGRRIRGFKAERLLSEGDKTVSASAAAAAIAAASPKAKSAEELAREARLEEAAEVAAAELAEHHGMDVEGGDAARAAAATKSPRSHKKSAKVGAVPPPPKDPEPAAAAEAAAAVEKEGADGDEHDEHAEHEGEGGDSGAGTGAGAMPATSPVKKGKGKSSTPRKKTVYRTNAPGPSA